MPTKKASAPRTSAKRPAKKAQRATVAKKAKPAKTGTRGAPKRTTKAMPAKAARNLGPRGVDAKLASLGDWRAATLTQVRQWIHDADPSVVEEIKWVKPSNPLGVPTWSHDGILLTGETYNGYVKLNFAYGASLPDPAKLFNAGFAGGTRRAIDLREGDRLDGKAFKDLVRAAVAHNQGA